MAVKGKTNNPHGRPTGSKNARTEQWEELGQALVTKHAERANRIMAESDDETFMDNFHKLLEYFKPKQARTEIKQDGPSEMIIRVIEEDGRDK